MSPIIQAYWQRWTFPYTQTSALSPPRSNTTIHTPSSLTYPPANKHLDSPWTIVIHSQNPSNEWSTPRTDECPSLYHTVDNNHLPVMIHTTARQPNTPHPQMGFLQWTQSAPISDYCIVYAWTRDICEMAVSGAQEYNLFVDIAIEKITLENVATTFTSISSITTLDYSIAPSVIKLVILLNNASTDGSHSDPSHLLDPSYLPSYATMSSLGSFKLRILGGGVILRFSLLLDHISSHVTCLFLIVLLPWLNFIMMTQFHYDTVFFLTHPWLIFSHDSFLLWLTFPSDSFS